MHIIGKNSQIFTSLSKMLLQTVLEKHGHCSTFCLHTLQF